MAAKGEGVRGLEDDKSALLCDLAAARAGRELAAASWRQTTRPPARTPHGRCAHGRCAHEARPVTGGQGGACMPPLPGVPNGRPPAMRFRHAPRHGTAAPALRGRGRGPRDPNVAGFLSKSGDHAYRQRQRAPAIGNDAPGTPRRGPFAARHGIHNARGRGGALGMERREILVLKDAGDSSAGGLAGRLALWKAACLLQALGASRGRRLAWHLHGPHCGAPARRGRAARQAIGGLLGAGMHPGGASGQGRCKEFNGLVAGGKDGPARPGIAASARRPAAAGTGGVGAPKLAEGKKGASSRRQHAPMRGGLEGYRAVGNEAA